MSHKKTIDPQPMTPTTETLAVIIAERAGVALPIDPLALALALDLKLTPRAGAVYSLRGARIVYDPRWPKAERLAMVARACAVYALHRAGMLKWAGERDISTLVGLLCGAVGDVSSPAIEPLMVLCESA